MCDYINPELVITWDYLAGFFDGEGCVEANVQKSGYPAIALSISQSDEKILKRIQRFLNAGYVYEHKPRGRRRRIWNWRVHKLADVLRIARELLKYVRIERKRRALQWVISFGVAGREDRQKIVTFIQYCNQNIWNQWLD